MITVDRKQFTRAIALASSVVERRNTVPILGALKAVANGSFALQGTNLDETTLVEIPYQGGGADFILDSAPSVAAAINAAGGETVELTPHAPGRDSSLPRITLSAGALTGDLVSLPVDDHPGADRILFEEFAADIGPAELAQIARITRAISTEGTRYYLNGICVRKLGDWTWRFAATDGHRLMMVDVPLPNATGAIPDNTIIPRRWLNIALGRFRKAQDGARLTFGRLAVRNEAGPTLETETPGAPRIAITGVLDQGVRFTLTGKLIDGTYPDYGRVIPHAVKFSARMRRAELAQAIHALTPFANEKVRAVKLRFETGHLVCQLTSTGLGTGTFRVPCENNAEVGFEIGFNAGYLLDMCASLTGEEIELGMSDSASPTIVHDPADTAFRAVLMPMRNWKAGRPWPT